MKDFRQLTVWQREYELALDIYKVTRKFPREEVFGLTSQLRRSSVSIAANLAENSDRELARFCSIALGSASETEYHLLVAQDLELLSPEEHQRLTTQTAEVKRMLTGWFKS